MFIMVIISPINYKDPLQASCHLFVHSRQAHCHLAEEIGKLAMTGAGGVEKKCSSNGPSRPVTRCAPGEGWRG